MKRTPSPRFISLRRYEAFLQASVRTWKTNRSFELFTLLHNVLTCYPELQPTFDAAVKLEGYKDGLHSLLDVLLADTLGSTEAAILNLAAARLSVARPDSSAAILTRSIGANENNVSLGEQLFYSASLKYLRRKFAAPNPTKIGQCEQLSADLLALRAKFEQRHNVLPEGELKRKYGGIDSLHLIQEGRNLLPLLSSESAKQNPETGYLMGFYHEKNLPLARGPYIRLPDGAYRYVLEIYSSKKATLELRTGASYNGSFHVKKSKKITLDRGITEVSSRFHWPIPCASDTSLFEVQIAVIDPTVVKVELRGFTLE